MANPETTQTPGEWLCEEHPDAWHPSAEESAPAMDRDNRSPQTTEDHVHTWTVADVYWAEAPHYWGTLRCSCGALQRGRRLTFEQVEKYLESADAG